MTASYLAWMMQHHSAADVLVTIRSMIHDPEPPPRPPDATMIMPVDPWLGMVEDENDGLWLDTAKIPFVGRATVRLGRRPTAWIMMMRGLSWLTRM